MEELESVTITKYTKHYYIGSERVASALGSIKSLGMLCEGLVYADAALIAEMNDKVEDAGEILGVVYDTFEKDMLLPAPFFYNEVFSRCDRIHYQDMYHPYWYHPDHLGSSSYITNLDGEINQHLEYLPFGETLVEEHLNSNNSPFKFNGKELDPETGNYYYGARYYNPKWSIWLSVDPLAEEFPEWTPYHYVHNNPINMIDPDGRSAFDWFKNEESGDMVWFDSTDESFTNNQGEWTNIGANEQEVKQNLNIPEDKQVSWNTLSGVTLGGRRGAIAPVTVNNYARISFDLNIEGNEGPFGTTLVDGQSKITGVNVTVDLSSGTNAPGVQLTHIGGNFGLENWTPMGKINTTTSSPFSDLSYPTLSPNSTHAAGTATMPLSLPHYSNLSRNFSQTPNMNLNINSTAGFNLQSSTSSSSRFFRTSTNIRF